MIDLLLSDFLMVQVIYARSEHDLHVKRIMTICFREFLCFKSNMLKVTYATTRVQLYILNKNIKIYRIYRWLRWYIQLISFFFPSVIYSDFSGAKLTKWAIYENENFKPQKRAFLVAKTNIFVTKSTWLYRMVPMMVCGA